MVWVHAESEIGEKGKRLKKILEVEWIYQMGQKEVGIDWEKQMQARVRYGLMFHLAPC